MKASRVLLIVVLFVTSFTFGILYVYRYVYQKDLIPSSVSTGPVAAAIEENDSSPSSSPASAPAPTVTYSAFPRLAYTYDGVSVGVTGTSGPESLLDYYAFGGYIFVILTTSTDGEDYRADGPSIALARFDEACTLTDTVTLPRSSGYTYLTSAMYDFGLMLVAATPTDLRVWTVSTNLSVRTVSFPYVATAAKLVYDNGVDVLCATGDTLHLFALDADLRTAWYHATPTTQSLVDLYTYGETFVAVCTDRTSGSAYLFDRSGYRSRAVLPAVSAVTPYAGGYAVASLADSTLYFMDYQFTRTGALPLPTDARSVSLASYDNGVLCVADSCGYLLCNHGDVQYSFTVPAYIATPITYRAGRFYFATSHSSTTTLYAYSPFTATPAELASYVGATSPELLVQSGYLYCFCTSTFDYGFFSGSLGDADVYLLRRNLP